MKFDSETLVIARAISILERRMASRCDAAEFSSPESVKAHARLALSERPFEVFACYFLDVRQRLIAFEELFTGTIDGASVHPRVVVCRALELNAAAVIFLHNHPSGVAEPSGADMAITRRLKEALSLVDVRTLDHLVVGADEPVSFAERGLL
ncbi:MAG: DNA repair protein RadC [Gammaproteobacteria bacterium]|nr:DNA repair protein RadC [Gammaproteobacteria bacterium]MCP5135421.1 DNA repair protein RadC [Gammaproteobacteria bacterium]